MYSPQSLKPQEFTLRDKIDYVANSFKSIDLPTNGYITELELRLHVNVSTGTSVTWKSDALWRLIKQLRIYSTEKDYIRLIDLRLVKARNILDYAGKIVEPTLPGANQSNVDLTLPIKLHFGYFPHSNYDTSVIIPAAELKTLKLEVLWGDNTDLGTGVTINSADITITVRQVLGRPSGYEIPAWQSKSLTLKVTDEYGVNVHDIEGFGYLYRILHVILDSNDDRSDDVVSRFSVYFVRERERPIELSYDAWHMATALKYGLETTQIVGITEFSPVDIWGIRLDLDQLRFSLEKIELDYPAKAEGTIKMLYDASMSP